MATGTYPTEPDAAQLGRVVELMQKYHQLPHPVSVKSMLTLAA
jgi:hypothetical protein